jgi:hypothetical protein
MGQNVTERFDDSVRSRVSSLLAEAAIDVEQVAVISEAGSTAHNISAGNDDLDFTVVWTESFRDLVEANPRRGSQMLRTQPEGMPSGPGDIDLQVYSMRRFVGLCATGNPSALLVLFTPDQFHLVNTDFPAERISRLTRSRKAAEAFEGYMDSQLSKWKAHNNNRAVSRPELVAAAGYDTKYAAHAIRLGIQGIEYLSTGMITMPMKEEHATLLRQLRAGAVTEPEAQRWVEALRSELKEAAMATALPERPDNTKVLDFLVSWHAAHSQPTPYE